MPTLIAPVPVRDKGAATTRGVLFIHACTRALSPHVEWAISQVLDRQVSLTWIPQPVAPGAVRTEFSWQAEAGTAARMVSSLRSFSGLRYEVTEDPMGTNEGERYAVTPELGIFRANIGVHGDIVIPEDRLRAAMSNSARTGGSLRSELEDLLGTAWDAELEPFRYAGDGAPIRYLHRVG